MRDAIVNRIINEFEDDEEFVGCNEREIKEVMEIEPICEEV